jgi:hypothetical protein
MTIVGSHQWSNTPKSLEGKDGHSFLMWWSQRDSHISQPTNRHRAKQSYEEEKDYR